MKKLYLHVGYGKTGSSALQSWLATKTEELEANGFDYKILDKNSINYNISSGNGAFLRAYLDNNCTEEELINTYFSSDFDNVIISSETLEMDESRIKKLQSFLKRHSIEMEVIAYLRNVYDCFYSTYVQGVKRGGLTASILESSNKINPMRHIDAAETYCSLIENIKFIHYDTHKADVALPFCIALGLDYSAIGEIHPTRVNRTLNKKEIDVVKFFVEALRYKNEAKAGDISRLISDYLVNTYKDIKSEVFVHSSILELFEKKYSSTISDFNSRIGHKHGIKIQLLDEKDPRLQWTNEHNTEEKLGLDREIVNTVFDLIIDSRQKFNNLQLANLSLALKTDFPGLARKVLDYINNVDLDADILRDSALALEGINIRHSAYLMELAHISRPDGTFINKKLKEYEANKK